MDDLLDSHERLFLPERLDIWGRVAGNLVQRIAHAATECEVRLLAQRTPRGRTFWKAAASDGRVFAIVDSDTTSSFGCDGVLKIDDVSTSEKVLEAARSGDIRWLSPKPRRPGTGRSQRDDIVASWKDQLQLTPEEYGTGALKRPGFRAPQLGAIYATKAHWSVSNQPATLVLPTGTGKTDTMVALLVDAQLPRLLVIVPTDPLRRQIGRKFADLGILKTSGLVPPDLPHPTVAYLGKGLKTRDDVDAIADECNVLVATMDVLNAMPEELKEHLAGRVSHLFVDEAHHIGARTWKQFKLLFLGKAVLQFTATPFRNDGRRVDGRFIYVYPLRRAQSEGLFTSIRYVPIFGQGEADSDRRIADTVEAQLEDDARNGFNHFAMARTNGVERAEILHALYERRLPQYKPQLIHSRMSAAKRAHALAELRAGRSRIIVCVDMLGEGFDLPNLKIAALHDRHKSESVTLQFVGRFTRSRSDLGSATVIANVLVGDVTDNLNALFAEDADWNHILSVIGHTRTERERRREDLFTGFSAEAETFPAETLEPRFNTVVYRTSCAEWRPDAAELLSSASSTIVEPPMINAERQLVIFVRRDEERLRWTSMRNVRNVAYNMVMVHWDADTGLLFIHSSDLSDLHLDLAKAIGGDDVERITGEQVFRVLHGFRRLMLTNLGLSETQRKPVRYSQFMGSDIADQLDSLPGNRSRSKTNMFGLGYVDVDDVDHEGAVVGSRAAKDTIGCSRKGKFWSYRTTNSFSEWIDWCRDIGRKLLNESITPETILRNVIKPKRMTALPSGKVPIGIAWPEEFLDASEALLELTIAGRPVPFFECDIELDAFSISDTLRFRIESSDGAANFSLRVGEAGAVFTQEGGADVSVRRGRSRRERTLVEIFQEDPPHIYFSDGDVLVAPDLLVLPRDESFQAFDPAKFEAVDWTGIDIRAESQGPARRVDTVQRRIIERALSNAEPYDVIFDDDGAGEVADIVAIRRTGRTLVVDLFHCKYSAGNLPGSRAEDLYKVCGQAQKSVRWAGRLTELLNHLLRRENHRLSRGRPSRFEKGSITTLMGLINRSREMHAEFSVTIVQPGYSKAKAANAHLELLAATESYLMETWRIRMKVLTSA